MHLPQKNILGIVFKIRSPLKVKFFINIILLSFLIFSFGAEASPQNGFGAYLGVIGAREKTVNSLGLNTAIDAQFTVNEKYSLNPYLMISAEKNSDKNRVSDLIIGIQGRKWYQEKFVGVHLLLHTRVIYNHGHTLATAYGPGLGGILAGIEYPSGWGSEGQFNLLEGGPKGQIRNAVTINLTYRWY